MHDDSGLSRRMFLRAGVLGAVALAGGRPLAAAPTLVPPDLAGPDDEMTDAVRTMLARRFGSRPIRPGHVQLDIPVDAPDGRLVPVILDIDLPPTPESYVSAYHLIVDHNPDVYVAGFHLTPACSGGFVETRIKMRRTSYVRAIAEMNTGELWSAAVKVFVGLNGCG